jgi:hypothetical protein
MRMARPLYLQSAVRYDNIIPRKKSKLAWLLLYCQWVRVAR